MVDLLILGLGPAVLVAAVLIYVVAMRTRHYTSTLTCPNCQRTFEYKWVPLASFSAVRLGKSRYLKCPLCNQWATFNIRDTRVQEPRARTTPASIPK